MIDYEITRKSKLTSQSCSKLTIVTINTIPHGHGASRSRVADSRETGRGRAAALPVNHRFVLLPHTHTARPPPFPTPIFSELLAARL
jgi:hypothetical protein